MKTVVLIRHAKSDKKAKKLRDLERPLNKRGLRDAPEMGKVLKNIQVAPQLILSSPAVRALKTAELIATEFGIGVENILTDPNLYMESKSTLLNVIKQIDDKYNVVFVVSHNPGLTDLVNFLTIETIEDIPTSGIAGLQIESDNWSQFDMGTGKLLFFETPKKQREAINSTDSVS